MSGKRIAKLVKVVELEFSPGRDDLGKGKELRDGLSVVLQIGDTIWVANDESISLERLTLLKDNGTGAYKCARQHKQFCLADYLHLPKASRKPENQGEVDVEGLDHANGYMWVVGSHSLKRAKPVPQDGPKEAARQLAQISADGNRYLLARIPVVQADGTPSLVKKAGQKNRRRTAAQLHGNARGNDLTRALKADKHLGPFLAIPGKDNGFDIEGLAVAGKRIFLGLRGPVLRGWAVILEVHPVEESGQPSTLRLKPIGEGGSLYRKHFLQLGGLGIRDICAQGPDLLVLAGPTMDLDGPVTVFRWRDAIKPGRERVVPSEELERVLDIPYGQASDHAEGIALFRAEGATASSLLVVYDSASEARQRGQSTAVADVFRLPIIRKKGKP